MKMLIIIALLLATILPNLASAQVCIPRPGLDFGGLIINVSPCLNGAIFTLVSLPQFSGLYFFQVIPPISQLCKYWVPPHRGQWTLGKYSPGACCFVFTKTQTVVPPPPPALPIISCRLAPIRGTVQYMGVSR